MEYKKEEISTSVTQDRKKMKIGKKGIKLLYLFHVKLRRTYKLLRVP